VVITGLGAVTPFASDVATSWERVTGGRSAAGPITAFDPREFMVRFACEAKDFDPTRWIEHRQVRRMGRFAQLVVAAARQAEADAGLEVEKESDRIGASVATAMGGLQAFEDCCFTLSERGPERVNPFSIPSIIPNMGAAWVSIELGTRGPLGAQCTACAASQMAIGEGLDAIRLGRAEVMFCGGTDAAITRSGVGGFAALRALSRRNDVPAAASRPFDADRDGFVMGEAGAILVLEELTRASGGRRSTRSWPVTASPRTPSTSPNPTRQARTPRGRCGWRSPTPGSAPTRSTTSTRTAPRPRWGMRARRV